MSPKAGGAAAPARRRHLHAVLHLPPGPPSRNHYPAMPHGAIVEITSPSRGLGTGFRNRTRSGRMLSATCGCGRSPVAEGHTYPPSGRNCLRLCPSSRECGGAVVASREHVWCISRAGSRQPGHDRRRAFAPAPGQEIADGHRYPRVLHGVVVRRFGGGRMRTTSRHCWSGCWGVGCAGGDRHRVVDQRRRHLWESAVNP